MVMTGLLVLTMVGMVSAERKMLQDVISVTCTPSGVVEKGLSFWVYDGGPYSMVEKDGVKVANLDAVAGSTSRYLYFQVDNNIVNDGPFLADFTFTYMPLSEGKFRLLYDNNVTGNRYTDSGYVTVKKEDVGKWVTYTYSLKDVMFRNLAAAGTADFRFHAASNLSIMVKSLEIKLKAQ
jgi:hypothetical protein